ncbi:UNVERIFIED_CONTAM: hypothetical protein GTU68_013534 [Idotea baltica]|nr:hypothetical protein [Idotea baltica]
MRLFAKLA